MAYLKLILLALFFTVDRVQHTKKFEAISYGVVKMNIDTDTQWAYWDGVRGFEAKNREYLQGQTATLKELKT